MDGRCGKIYCELGFSVAIECTDHRVARSIGNWILPIDECMLGMVDEI